MTSLQGTTTKQYLFTQSLVYVALIIGQLLFAVVIVYLRSTQPEAIMPVEPFHYVLPVVAVAGLLAGFQLFKWFLKKAIAQPLLKDKVSRYSQATIVRYALLEAPALFSLVIYFLTGHLLFIAIAALMIGTFLFVRPTKDRLIQDLQLSADEQAIVNNPDALLTERSFPNQR